MAGLEQQISAQALPGNLDDMVRLCPRSTSIRLCMTATGVASVEQLSVPQ